MPPTTTEEPTLLDKLHERRNTLVDEWSTRINAFEAERTAFETRSADEDEAKRPTDEEREAFKLTTSSFDADNDQRKAEIRDLDGRISDQSEIVRRRVEAAEAQKPAALDGVQSEPMTYRRDNGRGSDGISYYRDLACTQIDQVTFGSTGRNQSMARLQRHAAEMEVEVPRRIEVAAKRAQERVALAETRGQSEELTYDPFHRGALYNPVEKRVEPNRTDGFGGYLIPPLWLSDEVIPGLRAHLVAAGLCRQMDLPMGTDSVNIPKLSTLTAVGYQSADNQGVVSQDWTDTFVQANVKTAAGQSDVSLQLLEQSPNGITDEVITTDLMSAFNTFVDGEVVHGDGLNTGQLNGGHIQGLYNGSGGSAWTSANTLNFGTGAKPYDFQQLCGAMASQIARTRFDTTNIKFVMHGRRWFWYSTGLDGNDRPLGETQAGGPFNISAVERDGLQAEGLVGTLPSVANAPVYIDDNIGTADTANSATAADYALAFLADDAWLFMGDMRTNVFREVLSGTLGVRFQLYSYFAFLLRYGQSLAVATGAGFNAPTGQNITTFNY